MVKFYALDPSFIHDAEPTDGFVIDMVRASDYVELEKRIAELEKLFSQEQNKLIDSECHVADLEKQRDGLVAELNAVEKIHTDAVFITDDDYDKCPDSVKKVISSLAVISLPASKVAIAEIGAKVVEGFADCAYTLEEHDHAISYANKLRGGGV